MQGGSAVAGPFVFVPTETQSYRDKCPGNTGIVALTPFIYFQRPPLTSTPLISRLSRMPPAPIHFWVRLRAFLAVLLGFCLLYLDMLYNRYRIAAHSAKASPASAGSNPQLEERYSAAAMEDFVKVKILVCCDLRHAVRQPDVCAPPRNRFHRQESQGHRPDRLPQW